MALETSDIMIISRGRGRGHAMPDMAIAAKLRELVPNVHLTFVSYADGAVAYRACGYDVIDLQAPENPPLFDMMIAFTRLFRNVAPQMVIAHEEIPALPVAAALDIPCIFITDFFMDPNILNMGALQYAREIIFLEEHGLYTEPPHLRGKVQYVGRAVRPFTYTLSDHGRARRELGIPANAIVALCQPGGWREAQVPLGGLLEAAWNLLPFPSKYLIWLAGQDYELLAGRFGERTDVRIVKEDWALDRLMAASNIVITKANRMTVYEASALGLPSISVSRLLNWPDDVAVGNVSSNTALAVDSATPQLLAEIIQTQIGSKPTPALEFSGGVAGAASRIAHHVLKMCTVQ